MIAQPLNVSPTAQGADLAVANSQQADAFAELGRRLRELGATEEEVDAVLTSYELLFSEVATVNTATAQAAFVLGCHAPRRLPLVDAFPVGRTGP